MVRIIDESRDVDMTAKFNLGDEVYAIGHQSYHKGVVQGIQVNTDKRGTIFLYIVEFFNRKRTKQTGQKERPWTNKCLEKFLYESESAAIDGLRKLAETRVARQEQDGTSGETKGEE